MNDIQFLVQRGNETRRVDFLHNYRLETRGVYISSRGLCFRLMLDGLWDKRYAANIFPHLCSQAFEEEGLSAESHQQSQGEVTD